jgi:4-hydroxythreonine-4-phosphate dehydrogenase
MEKRPNICLTPGCPNGIGPEVLAKSLLALGEGHNARFLFAGCPDLLAQAAKRAECHFAEGSFKKEGRVSPKITCLFENHELPPVPPLGDYNEDALIIQARAIQKAITLGQNKTIQGLVTGPIRKAALKHCDTEFAGHTEYLHAHLSADANPPLMAFSGGPFVLGLATIHIPLNKVASQLSQEGLKHHVRRLHALIQTLKQKKEVHLTVLGLNPHAGESGLLGREEEEIIQPAIRSIREDGLSLQGPLSADGFFARFGKPGFEPQVDGVLAMYHDQGLAPYKILAGGRGVNITSGLTIARTSPDHGTADDIAGKNRADASAMRAAIETCLTLVNA